MGNSHPKTLRVVWITEPTMDPSQYLTYFKLSILIPFATCFISQNLKSPLVILFRNVLALHSVQKIVQVDKLDSLRSLIVIPALILETM